MISGKPSLPLWYYREDEYNVERIFQGTPYMYLINLILKNCVVEHEGDCWKHSEEFLMTINKALSIIESAGEVIAPYIARACRVCSVGTYEIRADADITEIRNLGFAPAGNKSYKAFICNYCGHVQLFLTIGGKAYPAWQNKE